VLVSKVDLLWKNGAKDEGIILLEGVAITVFMETGLKVRCSCMQIALCDYYLGFWWEQAKDYPWKKYPLCPWWMSSLLIRRIFWFLFCLFVFFELENLYYFDIISCEWVTLVGVCNSVSVCFCITTYFLQIEFFRCF
jgi:hypothetical protein